MRTACAKLRTSRGQLWRRCSGVGSLLESRQYARLYSPLLHYLSVKLAYDGDEILACNRDAQTAQLFFKIGVELLNYNHPLHLLSEPTYQVRRNRIGSHQLEEGGFFEDLSGVLIS